MYKVKQVADLLKCNPNAIRFYEKKGLLTPERGENRYREYSKEDVEQLQFILLYRQLGFSIEAIKQLCNRDNRSKLDIYTSQFNVLNNQIHSMVKIREALGNAIDELLESNEQTPESKKCLEETIRYISETNQWKDVWDFDSWASNYDRDIRVEGEGLNFYKNYDDVIDITANEVVKVQGDVVEIGIGTGNLAKKILEKFETNGNVYGNKMIGIDQSINMLREAKKKIPNLVLRTGTYLKLPIEDYSCDTIVSSYAFHHCNSNEKRLAIIEMDRVLRSRGRIIITDLMFKDKEERIKFEQNCTKREKSDLEDEYFGNVDEVEEILEFCGYKTKHVQIDDLIWMVVGQKTR
jgi:putative AdoMet-dependent methyltransferase